MNIPIKGINTKSNKNIAFKIKIFLPLYVTPNTSAGKPKK
jgi:hypothetical protein